MLMKKNMSLLAFALLVVFGMNHLESSMFHRETIENEWKEENLSPFNELMISWNAARPIAGAYLFYVSVKTEEWSPWLLYASWRSDNQKSFHHTTDDGSVRVYQDALELMKTARATGFQIRVVEEGDAPLNRINRLHVYTNGDQIQESVQTISYSSPVYLPVKGLSQITLNHIRNTSLCSPTSTTAVVRYLLKNEEIDPLIFAQNVWDGGFDIFGNWVFNVAEAAAKLGPAWNCWTERLNGFDEIYLRLHQGWPVIVSVRGPLKGSAMPYASGHLIAVIGYDPQQQKVICMDPAFPSDDQTHIYYDLSDFLEAWNRRGRIAYLFQCDAEGLNHQIAKLRR